VIIAIATQSNCAMHHTSVGSALALTSMGAAGTALGGLLVVAQPQMSFRRLGALQVGIAS